MNNTTQQYFTTEWSYLKCPTSRNHSTTTKAPANVSAQKMLPNIKYALYNKGDDLLGRGNYTQAIPYLDLHKLDILRDNGLVIKWSRINAGHFFLINS